MPTLPGGAEWIIILFIVLLLFGAKKLPGLASSMGTAIREFRRGAGEQEQAGTPSGRTAGTGSATNAGVDQP